MPTGLWNLKDIQNLLQKRSKNKLVRENTVTSSARKLLAPGYGLLPQTQRGLENAYHGIEELERPIRQSADTLKISKLSGVQ